MKVTTYTTCVLFKSPFTQEAKGKQNSATQDAVPKGPVKNYPCQTKMLENILKDTFNVIKHCLLNTKIVISVPFVFQKMIN